MSDMDQGAANQPLPPEAPPLTPEQTTEQLVSVTSRAASLERELESASIEFGKLQVDAERKENQLKQAEIRISQQEAQINELFKEVKRLGDVVAGRPTPTAATVFSPPTPTPGDNTAAMLQAMLAVQQDLQLNNIIQSVRKFHGNSNKEMKAYLRELETARASINATDDQMRSIVLRSSRDTAMDYVQRYVQKFPKCTWNELRLSIKQNFSDLADQETARRALHHAKQGPNESRLNLRPSYFFLQYTTLT